MVLLDTHVLLWVAQGSARLGPAARRLIERASGSREAWVSAISFWEIALLAERGRITLRAEPEQFRADALSGGFREWPLSGEIAIRGAALHGLHPDPADRFIVASAIVHGAALVTADERLLDWRHRLRRHDACL
jgi:PIN domain nuclease of toxin-antitoxin system